MKDKICPLCENLISEWAIATARVTTVNGKICHNGCLHCFTPKEVEEKTK